MSWWQRLRARTSRRLPEGPEGIRALGHRRYVGGHWEALGALQLDLLRREGLRPSHRLVDVACGALRAGVHLIPWLDAGNYHGIEKEAELIRLGLEQELPTALAREKRPQFVVSAAFEFERFGTRFDYAIANSLFTHLPPAAIEQCLGQLRGAMEPGGRFLATFFETDAPQRQDEVAHDHGVFRYTRAELQACAADTGWRCEYVGDFGHPRGQRLLRLLPDADP